MRPRVNTLELGAALGGTFEQGLSTGRGVMEAVGGAVLTGGAFVFDEGLDRRVESWRGNPLGCPLSVSGVSPFVARLGTAVAPFPAPATSHAACGFTALTRSCTLRLKGYETYLAGVALSRGRTR